MWEHIIPEKDWTINTRHLAGKTLVRSLCKLEELALENEKPHIQLFLLVHYPELADNLNVPICLRCDWTKQFLSEQLPFGGIGSTVTRHRMLVYCRLVKTDNGFVESLWSWVRRLVTTRSCHTKGVPLGSVSSKFVISRKKTLSRRSDQLHYGVND